MSNILRFPPIHSSQRTHPFEKPLELLSALLLNSTRHGDVVCDPFAGVASTLVAAKQSGRSAIGCELSEENWLLGQSRLTKETSNGTPPGTSHKP